MCGACVIRQESRWASQTLLSSPLFTMHIAFLEVLIALSVRTALAAPQLGITIGTGGIGTFTFPTATPTTTVKVPTTTTFQIPPSDTWGLGDVSRITDIFANITGLPPLPDPTTVVNHGDLNVENIQGDILIGMRKQVELFFFFSINNPSSFKSKLRNTLLSQITTTLELLSVSTQPVVSLNIAFSQAGLTKLGKTDNLRDALFSNGQQSDANNLGDPGTTNWVNAFLGKKIHGVFLIASDTSNSISTEVSAIESLFGSDITKQYSLQGNIRPPPFAGHEMFGYLDGVSQPAVSGFNFNPAPGQQVIAPGVILTGNDGDTRGGLRPSWTKDGSFLVFRQLKQLVPEFNKFLSDNAPTVNGLTRAQSIDLLGARMVGRWKSGAPVDLSPLVDNPSLGSDPNRNNNFDFAHSGSDLSSDQSRCPFSAHIRKSRPRADLDSSLNAIMRAGIPYGPEVSSAETSSNTSGSTERGLAFVCYQSQIDQGFQFIQSVWENNEAFPPGKNIDPGVDPINGAKGGSSRTATGLSAADTTKKITMNKDFVVSRGGEYFFAPSISDDL